MRAHVTSTRVKLAVSLGVLLAALAWSRAAVAQVAEPIGLFVADARGALVSYPDGDDVATPRGLTAADLPSRGFGVQLGGHVFLLRGRIATLGIGGSLLWSRGSKSPEENEDGTATGTAATTRMTAFSPQVSFNFGSGAGWSYASVGFGAAKRSISPTADASPEPGSWAPALDVGGGARWFITDHVGVSFDLRFYSVAAQEPGADTAGFPRTTKFVGTAGLSFK